MNAKYRNWKTHLAGVASPERELLREDLRGGRSVPISYTRFSRHAEDPSRCSIAEKVINNDDGCHRLRPPPPPTTTTTTVLAIAAVVVVVIWLFTGTEEERRGGEKERREKSVAGETINSYAKHVRADTHTRTTAAMERAYARSPPSPSGVRNIRLPITAAADINISAPGCTLLLPVRVV
ncbi:uncharacterized protein LOC143895866 [Temnothorax americanus]|uniref:uncharacterized protein LOC143895866 n=1 Tax=Temnothorax americanus TaxID=1964332 RepID=UPI0040676234